MTTLISFIGNLSDEDQQNRVLGEAHFLRGFSMLMLYRYYGGVPIRPVPSSNNPKAYPRNTPEETLEFILEDLQIAIDKLPEVWADYPGYEIGRPLKGSAYGMRMLANAYKEDWTTVISDFNALESSGRGYGLVGNYADLYHTKKENSIESLFEIQFMGGPVRAFHRVQGGHWLNEVTIPETGGAGVGVYSTYGGWGQWHISNEFEATFEPGDARRGMIIGEGDTFVGEYFPTGASITIEDGDYGDEDDYGCVKYFTGPEFLQGNGAGSSLNIHVMRFADAIMLNAEALAKTGNISGAYTQLNRIRGRAGLGTKSGGNLDQFMADLTLEKRHEGFAETGVWPELVRMGTAKDVLENEYGVTWESRWQYLPIPLDEMIGNAQMDQNDGY